MKRSVLVTAIAIMASGAASAAPIRQTIDVNVTVPAVTFYIKPQTGWPQAPVQISYDPVGNKFTQYTLPLQILSTGNDVSASLAFVPSLAEATTNAQLSLDVSVGGTLLDLTAKKVHAKAAVNGLYALAITSTQAKPSPGNYLGSVSLVFDEMPPPP